MKEKLEKLIIKKPHLSQSDNLGLWHVLLIVLQGDPYDVVANVLDSGIVVVIY